MTAGSEVSSVVGQASTVAYTCVKTDVVALRRLELKFRMQKLRLESEKEL